MIFNIQQIKSNFDMKWQAFDKNKNLLASVEAPFVVGKFQAKTVFCNSDSIEMYYNPYDTSFGTKLTERLSFKIIRKNELIGSIVGKTKKIGFLKSYPYYEMIFNDEIFYGYEVGFGNKGLFFCVYKGDELIAIVDKNTLVINYKDSYTVYVKNEAYAETVIIFTTYYDVVAYGDIMEIALLSISKKNVNTIQKELVQKYDPKFIPLIKAQEGME